MEDYIFVYIPTTIFKSVKLVSQIITQVKQAHLQFCKYSKLVAVFSTTKPADTIT